MKTWFKAYAAAWLVIGLLDALWLGVLARDFYRGEMAELMGDQVRVLPAALFYLVYPAGLVTLALFPRPMVLKTALLRSALVGVMAYGTYDATNYATLEQWTLPLTLVDVSWGVVVSLAGGCAGWFATRHAARGA